MKSRIFQQRNSFLPRTIAIFLVLIMGHLPAWSQKTFTTDGSLTKITAPAENTYIDYTVPSNRQYLSLKVRGADGGKVDIQNIFKKIVRTGNGGQGATITADFKIGTGENELIPGSTLRLVIGHKGESAMNKSGALGILGAGGGGGTGVIYLPLHADGTKPSNWKLLLVAGGGGGGAAGTGGNKWDGVAGQITEEAYQEPKSWPAIGDMDENVIDGVDVSEIWGSNGYGGIDNLNAVGVSSNDAGGGGGTSYATRREAATHGGPGTISDAGSFQYITPDEPWVTDHWGGGPCVCSDDRPPRFPEDIRNIIGSYLMGNSVDLRLDGYNGISSRGGKGLFQRQENIGIVPIGGQGGSDRFNGGYGCGGGGGADRVGGGGGGYSGGWAGYPAGNNSDDKRIAGCGAGSYVNSSMAVPHSSIKTKNTSTTNPGNGYLEYRFFDAPASLAKGFYYNKNQSKYLLKSGTYILSWQGDGNLVLYQSGTAVWASHTNGQGESISFQGSDGNLVIRDSNNNAIWSSATADAQQSGKGGTELQLTSDGRLSILNVDGKELWHTSH